MIIDEAFEDKVLACLMLSNDFNVVACQYLNPEHFSGTVKHNIAKIVIDFRKTFDAIITGDAYVRELKKLIERKIVKADEVSAYTDYFKKLVRTDCRDHRYVLQELITFIKNREIKNLIEEAVKKHLPKNNFKAIEDGMAKIAGISTVTRAKPYEVFADSAIDEREERRREDARLEVEGRPMGIQTGIPALDKCLYKRGWFRRELYIILAPPKYGKSMALLFHANAAAWHGFNVAHFSFEVSRDVCVDRLDAQNAMIEFCTLHMRSAAIAKSLRAKRPKGKLFVFEYPTKTCTVAEMAQQVKSLEMEQGIKIHMATADYGDIMKPARRFKDDILSEQAGIYEDLRKMAGELDLAVLTASQINRSGTGRAYGSGTDVAGTYEKIMVADQVITLSATKDELKEGKLRIILSESRNNPRKAITISTRYNYGKFYESTESVEEA